MRLKVFTRSGRFGFGVRFEYEKIVYDEVAARHHSTGHELREHVPEVEFFNQNEHQNGIYGEVQQAKGEVLNRLPVNRAKGLVFEGPELLQCKTHTHGNDKGEG